MPPTVKLVKQSMEIYSMDIKEKHPDLNASRRHEQNHTGSTLAACVN